MFANIFSWLPVSWQWAEPILGYSAVTVALIYWIRLQLARRRRYANKGDCDFVVVVQVGRPVAEAAREYFGEVDALIDANAILAKTTLESDKDYKRLVKEFNQAIAPHQNSQIKVLLSGPIGLSALLGQSVGLQYNIVFHQFDAMEKQYVPLPQVERAWFR